MKPLTREWIGKAEGDLATVRREVQARKAPNYDAACFHAQQCIEKYLKARLQGVEIPFGRTHDLIALRKTLTRTRGGEVYVTSTFERWRDRPSRAGNV